MERKRRGFYCKPQIREHKVYNSELPDTPDWYKVRIKDYGEIKAPFVSRLKGDMVWLVPTPENVTHWLKITAIEEDSRSLKK